MRYISNLLQTAVLVGSMLGCTRDYSFLEHRDTAGDVVNRYDAGADRQVGADTDIGADVHLDSHSDAGREYDMALDARVDVMARDLGMDARIGLDVHADIQADRYIGADLGRDDGVGVDTHSPRYDAGLADAEPRVDLQRYDLGAVDAPLVSPDAGIPDGPGADRQVIIFPDAGIPDLYADRGADVLDLGFDAGRDLGADVSVPIDGGADVNTLCPEPAPLNTLQAGVCAQSRQSCGPTGWQDDYSSVTGYEVDESTIDRQDNDCDDIIDDPAWRQVSAGLFHTCALRNEGSVQCWGSNSYGQRDDVPAENFLSIDSGAYHNCGLTIDNTIECWGRNSEGQAEVPAGRYIQLDAGYNHTCGVKDDNTLECWGDNSSGQSSNEPLGRFTQVTAGISHNCAVKEDATIECWGNNADGRAPSFVAGNFSQVSAGNQHSCGLSPAGIECWGRSEQTTSRPGIFNLISSDYDYNCSLDLDGLIACWGIGEGVAGMGSPPAGNFTDLDVGVYHSCAVTLDGLIDCWGRDDVGPL